MIGLGLMRQDVFYWRIKMKRWCIIRWRYYRRKLRLSSLKWSKKKFLITRLWRYCNHRCLVCGNSVKPRTKAERGKHYLYDSFTCSAMGGSFSIKKGGFYKKVNIFEGGMRDRKQESEDKCL